MIQEKLLSPIATLQNAPGPLPWITLLGLDGSGKSTVVKMLRGMLAPLPIRTLHRLPGILLRPRKRSGNNGQTGISHYSKPPHSRAKSVLKLAIMVADWQIGYWRTVHPARQKGALVIADRHALLDLIPDPLRYRYGGSANLVSQAVRLTPMPNLIFLLDAPISVLQARKQELSVEKAEALRAGYLQLIQTLSNGRIINAAQPVDQVAASIIAHLALLVEGENA
jgi:thymidylate kinase